MTALVVIILLTVITCVATVFHFGDDGNKHPSSTPSSVITASEITKKVIAKMNYENIVELDSGNISGHFVIPEGSVTQSSICISSSADTALEVDCFKLTDESCEVKIKSAVSDHMATKSKGFKDSPEQSQMIKGYVCETYHGFTFVVVADNADVAVKTFKDIVDGK